MEQMTDPATIIPCPKCGAKNRVRPTESGVPSCASCHEHLPWIVEATPDTFEQEIKASVPVLVDFWAPWCGPCRMVSPLVERIGQENAGHLKVVKLNVDEAPAISERYAVRGIPLLVVIRDGAEADRLVGAVPYARLSEWVAPHLAASASAAAS
jgi:thioredoxin 2